MKKIKLIIKDIWRNYRVPLLLGAVLSIILTYHKDEMDLIWYIISMSIVLGIYPIVIGYGIIQYFRK